ncbi:hypothetical protein [Psychrobacillus sp. L3]
MNEIILVPTIHSFRVTMDALQLAEELQSKLDMFRALGKWN